jgi:hypothetical protein
MMVVTDPAQVNEFINHPAIFPHTCPGVQGPVDVGDKLLEPGFTFLLADDDAMMLFHPSEPAFANWWQKHNLFKPSCRGRRAIEVGKAMLAWLRDDRPVAMIWAQTPLVNRKARWFNRQIGLSSRGLGLSPILGQVEYFACQ